MLVPRAVVSLFLVSVCTAPSLAHAQLPATPGDWPSWRGPDRTGVSRETGLLKQWPEGGPKLLWKATGLGGGYATPSVAGGRLFVLGSKGQEEYLLALDIQDGKLLWSTQVGAVGKNDGPNYPGPRSTPTVDGDLLYALGSAGDLVCAATATGTILWRKQLVKDFEGSKPIWAYAESPLVDGDVLVCTPGGPTATMVALNKKTGAVLWKTEKPEANGPGYASAIVIEVDGIKQYIQFLGSGLIGVSAQDGRLLWRYNRHIGGPSCATPIFHDGYLFSTANGGDDAGGDALLRLSADGSEMRVQQIYLLRWIMSHHGGVLRIGEFLYGTTGAALVCVDFKTGKRRWQERSVGRGSQIAADGHLYVRNEQGVVALVEATPDGYTEKGRLRQPERSRFATFCHPVVASGRLYLRDEDMLFCYDVKEK
jgi:outer membrane protein assembly factor BamB